MGPGPAGDAVLSAYAQTLIRVKAKQLCRKPGFSESDEDDLKQELALHLLRQLAHYDPARGSVETFLARVADMWAAEVLRRRGRLKRGGGQRVASFEQLLPSRSVEAPTLGQTLTPLDMGRRLGLVPTRPPCTSSIKTAVATLPPFDQAVCRELMIGNVNSAARNLGVSRRQVQSAIDRIRRHLAACDLDEL